MNLLSMASRLGEVMARRPVSLDSGRCLHTGDQFSTCDACFDICPTGAIRPGAPPALDTAVCRDCFACLPACPVGAFTAVDDADALLACAARLEASACELLCQLNPNLEQQTAAAAVTIRVRGCLAGLGADTYLALVGQGVEKIFVRTEACADCPWQGLQAQVETHIQQTRTLLALWQKADALAVAQPIPVTEAQKRPFWNAASVPVSRRSLFRMGTQPDNEAPDTPPEPVPFAHRLRLLRTIRQLPPPTDAQAAATHILPGMDLATLSVSKTCTACGACARICPTEALQLETAGDQFRLLFSPQACVGCEACLHTCLPQAITIDKAPTFDQIFGRDDDQLLHAGALVRCAKCQTHFAPQAGEQFCPLCQFRRDNPFGTVLPPGLLASQNSKLPAAAKPVEGKSRDH